MAKKKVAKKSTARKAAKKAPSKKAVSAKLQVGKDIWPLERDVLFRPDRMKYVRKLIQPEGCVFCQATQDSKPHFESLCVYQTKHSAVVLNKFPYNPGHVLVIPKKHDGDMLNLSDVEFEDLQQTVRQVVAALKKVYNPGGINVGLNLGAVAGAGIPDHLHYHVIPRWSGDLNFFPLIAETKTVVETLETTFERLLAYFESAQKEKAST